MLNVSDHGPGDPKNPGRSFKIRVIKGNEEKSVPFAAKNPGNSKMRNPIEQHQFRLEKTLTLLRQGKIYSLSSKARQTMESQGRNAHGRLGAMEARYLTIGLVGGTGVGKSTLMNALAGKAIASTSHRRPHTDRVLIYRHAEADAPPIPGPLDVPRREILHQGDDIRRILLCDLPDFDSLVGEHP